MFFDKYKSKNVIKQFHKSLTYQLENDTRDSKKIEKVVLFVENEFDQEFVLLLSQNLGIDISNISVFKFKRKVEKNVDCKNCILKKDFGFFGKLTNDVIKRELEKPFDLVISLTQNNEFISNLVASIRTSFKAGFLDNYSQVYDLIINVESDDLLGFNGELKKYLKILNKL